MTYTNEQKAQIIEAHQWHYVIRLGVGRYFFTHSSPPACMQRYYRPEYRREPARKHRGLSIVIRNKKEFNHMKRVLGGALYLKWVPQMGKRETAIILFFDNEGVFSTGSVGCAKHQREFGVKTIEFSEHFEVKKY